MDTSLVHALNGFFLHHDDVEDPVVAYVDAAKLLFAGMLVVAFVVGRERLRRARAAAVAAGASAALALVLGQVVSALVHRPRPFVADPSGVHLFVRHAADAGFPSDHATAAFAIAVAVLLRNAWWGTVLLVAAGVLAAGRVAAGLHYPSDVLAGAVLGSLCALALWAPPLRRLLDRLAAAAGAPLDSALRRAARLGRA